MFERLVITNSESTRRDRKWYFLSSSVILGIALATGLVFSLFSKDLSLGTNDFELVQLVTPVEQPIAEPEPPTPEDAQQPLVKEQTVEKAPTMRVQERRPTRQVNMARVDETPPALPDAVSTQPNTQKARPANRYFELGKLDLDYGATYTPRRPSYGGSSSGSGAGSPPAGESISGVVKVVPLPPPPRIKKTPAVKRSVTRSLGVINGKATSLPKPRYPATARAVNVRGKVSVRVLINERGRVISANAVSGHQLLRNAAEAAARDARFSPTLLSGEAVKVSGVIVYNFLA